MGGFAFFEEDFLAVCDDDDLSLVFPVGRGRFLDAFKDDEDRFE